MKMRMREEEPHDIYEIKTAVQRLEGVVSVKDVSAREYGHYVFAKLVINVNPAITVAEGHEIARRVRFFILRRFVHVAEVSIYVEPYDVGYPYNTNFESEADSASKRQNPTILQ
jgi:divalent metal cation (Fe/Co/Zn/Cd) transporter